MLSLTSKLSLAVQNISSKSLHPTLCLCLRYSQIADNEQCATKYAYLTHRRILEVKGRDVSNFLQGIISNDVELLPQMKCIYSMILNQHGRVMHDVMLYHHQSGDENSVLLECETESVESLIKMLKLYKLRKKVSIELQEQIAVVHAMSTLPQSESDLPFTNILLSAADPRLPMLGHRILVENTKDGELENSYSAKRYHHKRIYTGIPEGLVDLPPGNCLPLECNLDYMNGVSFHKGCYIGQELTARTKFTGVIRKRLIPINIKGEGPIEPGTSMYTSKGRSAGKFRSMHPDGDIGLSIVRLNYVGETLTTKNGSHEFDCHIPLWWPSEDGTEFSDGVCGPVMEENA